MHESSRHLLPVEPSEVGGIAALWIFHLNLNLSASVGFIALLGVAVLNGVVLVSSTLLTPFLLPTAA
jgi:Cu/Ag efflux pump CusA